MKLTSDMALKLLDEARNITPNTNWIEHSICVGRAASVIADALNLDGEKAKTLGYIHDIGKRIGDFHNHAINGYNYLKELGVDDEYCRICLTHSYLNNDVYCTAGGVPPVTEFLQNFLKDYEYYIYDKIINLCDLMCTSKILTVEKRLIDILIRRGAYPNTKYHVIETYKLKDYIDELLGHCVYDLFPETKENL